MHRIPFLKFYNLKADRVFSRVSLKQNYLANRRHTKCSITRNVSSSVPSRYYSDISRSDNTSVSHQQSNIQEWADLMHKKQLHLGDSLIAGTTSVQSRLDKERENALKQTIEQELNDLLSKDPSSIGSIIHNTLKTSGYQKATLFCEEFFTVDQLIEILPSLQLSNTHWREENYFDLLVSVVSEKGVLKEKWDVDSVVKLLDRIPRLPLVIPDDTIPVGDNEISESWAQDIETNVGVIQADQHQVLWRPQELGKFIGTILSNEYELEYLVSMMTNFAKAIHAEENDVTWNEFLGYVNVSINSTLYRTLYSLLS